MPRTPDLLPSFFLKTACAAYHAAVYVVSTHAAGPHTAPYAEALIARVRAPETTPAQRHNPASTSGPRVCRASVATSPVKPRGYVWFVRRTAIQFQPRTFFVEVGNMMMMMMVTLEEHGLL